MKSKDDKSEDGSDQEREYWKEKNSLWTCPARTVHVPILYNHCVLSVLLVVCIFSLSTGISFVDYTSLSYIYIFIVT